jgi:glycine cleavage system transcriptional repressor
MHVAVTAIGVDRPGIVAAVTEVLLAHEGNIEDSRMAILGGHFAMMLIVALPERSDPSALERALAAPAEALDLVIAVRPVPETAHEQPTGVPYVVTVYGADRPGIVHRISKALASRGANITDLATHVLAGPTPVYVMIMELTMPKGTDGADVEADLKSLAGELDVDVSVRAIEAETL